MVFIFFGLAVAGCFGERKKSTDLKEGQSSASTQQSSNEMLNFLAEILDAGKKLPNIYENKALKYSIRYSADLESPSADEDGDFSFFLIQKDKEDLNGDFSLSVLNESDRLSSFLSAGLFAEAVVQQVKDDGRFEEVKAIRYEKNKTKDRTMFFLEIKMKIQSQEVFIQQYYFIGKTRIAVLTASFGDQESMKHFERDVQTMVSTFKFDN